jgi:L-ascorbate metabolism protein UlaG (beta-lactamase superfamily)
MALGRDTAITWLGHATWQITTPGGRRVLIDPWLAENPACPDDRKTVEAVDVMLLTHGHDDHTGDAVPVAQQHGPTVVAIVELCAWLQRQGVENLQPMNKGGTQAVGELRVTMTHAFHSSSVWDGEQLVYAGDPTGFVLRLENDFRIYVAGDTALFGDMRLIGELYRPDLAILPIGDHFTMGPREAAYALRLLGCRHVLPSHYGTFPKLTGTVEALRREAADLAGVEIHELRPGETLR